MNPLADLRKITIPRLVLLCLPLLPVGTLSNAGTETIKLSHSQEMLNATWLPPQGRDQGSLLAVNWRGKEGALLKAIFREDKQSEQFEETVVISDRPLKTGVNLFSVPLSPKTVEGTLFLEAAEASTGARLGVASETLEQLRATSAFAWESQFFGPGLDDNMLAAVVYTDPSGRSALYVGGLFVTAGSQAINHIARWDGNSWSSLGAGTNGKIFALTVYNGKLIAGGDFTQAGGVTANNIASWNGAQWSPLGAGTSGITPAVWSLQVFNSVLIAGGGFTQAGGVTVNGIASWNGTSWSPLGSGIDTGGTIFCLTVYNGNLIAGGSFCQIGGVSANNIASWNGSFWAPLGAGLSDCHAIGPQVRALTVYAAQLVAGGQFTNSGAIQGLNNIARWNGSQWSALGAGLTGGNNWVYALTLYNGSLVAAGNFTQSGATTVSNIALWNGSQWSRLVTAASGLEGVDNEVRAIAVFSGQVIPGGVFARAAGIPCNRIAQWNGTAWSAVGSSGTGVNGDVWAITIYNGDIVVGGRFTQAGSTIASYLARWDGTQWSSLGTGVSGISGYTFVSALAVYNGALIAGGAFTQAGGLAVSNIARWNGSSWSPLGTGLNDIVRALTLYNGALIAGGQFDAAGRVTAYGVASWNGSAWSALGSGVGDQSGHTVYALTAYNGELIAAGGFAQAGGTTVNSIARWDGSQWLPLSGPSGTGVNQGPLRAVTVYNGSVITGGAFTQAGGIPAKWIASWNGTQWSAVGDDSLGGPPCSPCVRGLTVFDNTLVAGGVFTQAGGQTVNSIARWDGNAWSPLSGPLEVGLRGGVTVTGGAPATSVWAFATLPPSGQTPEKLVTGGVFALTGGVSNWNVGFYYNHP